jgi:hypothetical protein
MDVTVVHFGRFGLITTTFTRMACGRGWVTKTESGTEVRGRGHDGHGEIS